MQIIKKLLFVSLFFTCFACHPKPADMPLGPKIGAPIGAVDYCHRHPEVENCKS